MSSENEGISRRKREIFPFSKYNPCSTFKARRSLDSGCPRDVDVATSHEQTTIVRSPSSRVMERENKGKAVSREGRASYTISYRPASIRLLVPQRVRSHGRPFSREAHLFRFSPPRHQCTSPAKNSYRRENFRPATLSFVHVRRCEKTFG